MASHHQSGIDVGMVLAAGFGKRMRHLTERAPKPLLAVDGRTLLDRALDRFEAAAINRVVVNVHYQAVQIEAHLRHRQRPSITISNERGAILDTGGGVLKALPILGEGPFVVQNADTVWCEGPVSNLAVLVKKWNPDQMDAILLLAAREGSLGYDGKGDFHLEADGRLRRRMTGENAPYVFAGASIIKPSLFEGIREPVFSLNAIFDRANRVGRLFGTRLEGTWIHVGTPEAHAEAERFLRSARFNAR